MIATSTPPSFDAVELLGERLLRLGRLAREVPTAEFLARAVHLLRETLAIRSAFADRYGFRYDGIVRAAWARPDGHLVYAGPALCELLYARWPAWDGLELPAELVQRFAGLPCTVRLPDGVLEISRQDEHVRLQRLPAGAVVPLLSPREQRVAHLFAAGLSYKEISRRLGLQPATVRTYLRNAYVRLGVSNKVQLGNALGSKSVR